MQKSLEATTVVVAPPDRVWALLADVVRWPEWLSTMTSVQPLDGGELALGARYRVTQPRLPPATWTVVRVEPGLSFAWESRSPGVRALADHLLRLRPDGSTSVTLRVEFSGPLAFLPRRLFGTLTMEYITREAALLKAHVEGDRARAGGSSTTRWVAQPCDRTNRGPLSPDDVGSTS